MDGMRVEVQIIDDEGKVQAAFSGVAWQPLQWKAPPNEPIICPRGGDNGAYKIYAITVQPSVVLEMGYGKLLNPNMMKVF